MALNKHIEKNNVDANYWRVVGFNNSITGKMCQIFLCGYESDETRLENKNVINLNYIVKPDKYDDYVAEINGIQVALLYEFLKHETEDFIDATDC